MRASGAERWAFDEFGRTEVADQRWRARLVRVAMRAARRPGGRVTDVFADDAGRQGAYGLLESEAVDAKAVGLAMFEACARRCAEDHYVFCAIDGTSLTLADHGQKRHGPIGSRSKKGRGVKVINAMALSPRGVPLGVCSQQWWTRPERKRRRHRDQLRAEEKETGRWLDAIKQTKAVMKAHAPKTRCWFQMDREADAWPLLLEAAQGEHCFTIRACRNRWVILPNGARAKLKDVVAAQPVRATYPLEVRAVPGSPARTATMALRACQLTLEFRDKRTRRRFPMVINVVQAKEQTTARSAGKPIEWTLLTNHEVATLADLTDIVRGYSMRWRIEELHRTWKSGSCRVEDSQLRSTNAVIKWGTILMAVAARIERIKQLSRQEPERPATDEFTPLEIKAAALLHLGKAGKALVRRGKVPTIAEVTFWVAKLGGYTGKSSGGPPGAIVIARGLDQVRAAAQAIKALDL